MCLFKNSREFLIIKGNRFIILEMSPEGDLITWYRINILKI
jgi:hypothetical protein